MRLTEGEGKNYSESGFHNELVVIDTSNSDYNQVVAFPEALLAGKSELARPELPFTIRVKEYFRNSEPRLRAPMVDKEPPQASQGIAQRLRMEEKEKTTKMDARDIPSAVVEIKTAQSSQGTWLVSNWAAEDTLIGLLRKQWGDRFTEFLDSPQQFTYQGQTYQLMLRPVRYYTPYSVQLLEFHHDRYKGTDTPKNFSSRVRLLWPERKVDREVLIYMNNPLRYEGQTYYQASWDPKDPRVTILQVVRNPGWLTPYLSCALVALGLLVQFLSHLIAFARKSSARQRADELRNRPVRGPRGEPDVAVPVGASANREAASFQRASKRRTA
jgi:hypothetical protein